ncbi:MAG: hypothetical protein A4E40_01518 [Methanoregulaceae archaeon PtaU1.Bin059]|nr:MAG: hypothetical protein A4E39_00773 [Methanoregulaceae archaeon PtaB.Bin152]OPY36300.1 MAG: hypothetical protein A4E40_01518 [Methanoregulaceae archaeon PtaU1.Bin059]
MRDPYLQLGGLLIIFLIGIGGAVLTAGCTEKATKPQENPFPGTWVYQGNVGTYNATILFTFYENMTGRYDMLVPDTDPPFVSSMEFPWESEGDRLFIGSSSEKQHLDVRYHSDQDRMVVLADDTSGIFVGEEFVTGPFQWEFFRGIKNDKIQD